MSRSETRCISFFSDFTVVTQAYVWLRVLAVLWTSYRLNVSMWLVYAVGKQSPRFCRHLRLPRILGPFELNADYLLVADYNQMKTYQLMPQFGDVRVLPINPCKPVSLVFDPTINGIYVICDNTEHFHIYKHTFDGTIDEAIYYSPQGVFAECLVCRIIVTFVLQNDIMHNGPTNRPT